METNTKYVTLRTWDPIAGEWVMATFLPRELRKELAWKIYLGHQYFKISSFEI